MLRAVVIALILTLFSGLAIADNEYTVELEILSRLNEQNLSDKDTIQKVNSIPHRIEHIIGLATIKTVGNVNKPPETFYLEWAYADPSGSEYILESGDMSGNKHLEFRHNYNRPSSYYWVKKRIWTDRTGSYFLRVKNKQREYVKEVKIDVGE